MCQPCLAFETWLQEERLVWSRWVVRLALLQPAEDELEKAIREAMLLRQLIAAAQRQQWEDSAYTRLWEQAFSGLAGVVGNCTRLAQLAQQQGTATVWAAVSESVHVLGSLLSCLQLCPREYLCSMPAASQQQYKALSQFFLTAGPQLLLCMLAVERSSGDLGDSSNLRLLAAGLQAGTRELLELPLSAMLKPRELPLVKDGLGRLLDMLELAAREARVDVYQDCSTLFDTTLARSAHQAGGHHESRTVLLDELAAEPSRAALAFRYFSHGVLELVRSTQEAASQPGASEGLAPDERYAKQQQGKSYLASMLRLCHSKALPGAVAFDPTLLGEVCTALTRLLEQAGKSLYHAAPGSAGRLFDGDVLQGVAHLWELCAVAGLKQHTSVQYIEQLLAAGARMVRVAAVVGGWQQEGRPGDSSGSSAMSLRDALPYICRAASRLLHQALSCMMSLTCKDAANLCSGSLEVALAAVRHALSAVGGVAAIWQQCHSGSSSRAAWPRRAPLGPKDWLKQLVLDPRDWLKQLGKFAIHAVAMLLIWLESSDLFQLLCSNHCGAAVDTLSLALQVQVKAVRALEIGWETWGTCGLAFVVHLSFCLASSLNLMTKMLKRSLATGRYVVGGCFARWPPAAPYLHIFPAVQTLLFLGRDLTASDAKSARKNLVDVLCWLLAQQGNSAVHAGAVRLRLDGCTDVLPALLEKLRHRKEATAALGAIPLLRSAAVGLGARDAGSREVHGERQLSMDAVCLLKRCCTAVDATAGTSFSAIGAEIEAEGAQLMRSLLRAGQPNAADTVRAHVWRRRSELLLPRLDFVVQQRVFIKTCPAHSDDSGSIYGCSSDSCSSDSDGSSSSSSSDSDGSSSSSSSDSLVPLCPWVAIVSELEMAAGRSCCSPGCCTVLVDEGSKLLVCRGCKSARYCSSFCAQADWQRHAPVCRALWSLKMQDRVD